MRDGIISEQMKSRLIKAGLPATYEELVALAADTGIPADILFNEEGWRQLPTYLSKANLLSDATEVAIWETAQNRTVNDALKMLADVAYGRVASLTLTVNDTAGNPIPDVTVRLDSAPAVGQDPTTGADGKIKLDTNAGEHTAYLVYPLGYSAETGSTTVQVTGNTATTVQSVSRKAESTIFNLTEAKSFYIARFLSPVQFDIRGGGGSGCAITGRFVSKTQYLRAQGGAGGYVTITDAVDVSGKLIRVHPGSGAQSAIAIATSVADKVVVSAGNAGGTTTVSVGEEILTASGGAGGKQSSEINNDGGAYGGGGASVIDVQLSGDIIDGQDGRYLFDDNTLTRHSAGGGGAFIYFDKDGDYMKNAGSGGLGRGTPGYASYTVSSEDERTADATNASGSGACISPSSSSSGNVVTGRGGPGFVAFRKAV